VLVCGGCGTAPDPSDRLAFTCPNAGDGGDHVLRRRLDLTDVTFPSADPEPQPFVRYRRFLCAYDLARSRGMSDGAFVQLIRELDAEVSRVDGRGFVSTPFAVSPILGERVGLRGPLWVKDETGGVAGSHKARHLFGLLLYLETVERLGLARRGASRQLAVASCGNAALAAAVVAAAGRRALQVFVPDDADPVVVWRLGELRAAVTVCGRRPGAHGDPTLAALHGAVAAGAVPFTCQGNENGLAIEGGQTIGYEMVAGLAAAAEGLDDVVVQVGGGALASAVAAAFAEAAALGALGRVPRVHTVQTEGAWPLRRAYELVSAEMERATALVERRAFFAGIARRRSEFMWPWEEVPRSIATGILDDETGDWLALVEAMLDTGGVPVVVGEDELARANALALAATGISVSATGSAGLAGLWQLLRRGVVSPEARVAVLFTGRGG
jgi:threonine synthase